MVRGTRREKAGRRLERRRAVEAGYTVEELRLADAAARMLGERPRAGYEEVTPIEAKVLGGPQRLG